MIGEGGKEEAFLELMEEEEGRGLEEFIGEGTEIRQVELSLTLSKSGWF